jgi:predicted RNase H-like nuclease
MHVTRIGHSIPHPTATMFRMRRLAGADGCKSGWIVVYKVEDEPKVDSVVVSGIAELFDSLDPDVLAIDIPIGLTESGARECDVLARRAIRPRGSSVFPAPIRAVMPAETYVDADRISRGRQDRGMSKQAFAICPKIREVDEALRANPQLPERVYEVHPEVTFCVWRGAAMNHSKKTQAGRADRMRLISAHFGEDAFETVRAKHRPRDVADDDILDAFAALRTAERIANGISRSLPEEPPFDAAGLPMRIVY